jgi:hypothetical protein
MTHVSRFRGAYPGNQRGNQRRRIAFVLNMALQKCFHDAARIDEFALRLKAII